MLISVIIPTCNRNDLLGKCLDLLAPAVQSIDASTYEVIVSDDSQANIAKPLLEASYPWARWIEGPKKGPAANRNNGAGHGRGTWLVFIDDDCLPETNILSNYVQAFEKYPGEMAFEGAIVPDDWNLLKSDLSECPVNTEGNFFWSANVAINASLFQKLQGFDEDYLIAAQEDQQMKIDIEQATGKPIIFLKNCSVTHPVRFTTVMKQLRKIPVASKNFCIYATKNKDVLNYNQSMAKFGLSQFAFHLRIFKQSLKAGKIKSLVVTSAWLFYGVPLNIINFSKLTRNR